MVSPFALIPEAGYRGSTRNDRAAGFFLPSVKIGKFVTGKGEMTGTRHGASGGPARVLLVEDEALVRTYMTTLVTALGCTVEAVARAQPALDLLATGEKFDLLLADVVLPDGISGKQLAETVLRDHPDMPVLLVSGYPVDVVAPDDIPAARIAFLRKPFRKRELARKFAELLDR